jgi:RNA recognition motif-containing protein
MEVFKICGTILAIQLAMDTSRNLHLGYGFIKFLKSEAAHEAIV